MKTMQEREDSLVELIRRHDHFTEEAIRDIVRLNLLGAAEEAVQADRRLAEKNKEALDEAIARAGASPRPTAEDALKAVVDLGGAVLLRSGAKISDVVKGCVAILDGHRDTPAARAIIGDEPINSTATGGG